MNNNINRRKFFIDAGKIAGVCGCGLASISLLNSCEHYWEKESNLSGIDKIINIDEESYLQKIGYGIKKSYKDVNYGIPVMIIRISDKEFVCFSTLCPHDNCFGDDVQSPLGNFQNFKYITCTCHGSKFDPYDGGKPVVGPAEKPLASYPTEYLEHNNQLIIHF
ncbi:MAG: ubiquinol-cytochrome c reductase iron-sulfur subunit [Candidatus Kapaibacterium sp.]